MDVLWRFTAKNNGRDCNARNAEHWRAHLKPRTCVAPYPSLQLDKRQRLQPQWEHRRVRASHVTKFCPNVFVVFSPTNSGHVFRFTPLIYVKRLSRSLAATRRHKGRWEGLTKRGKSQIDHTAKHDCLSACFVCPQKKSKKVSFFFSALVLSWIKHPNTWAA